MDNDRFVDLLNEDLQFEYQSIVQYVQHIATMKGPEFLSVVAELRAHLPQELQHAQIVAEQIDFLGGVPSVTVPAVASETDPQRGLELDLNLEIRQLERYRVRVEQAAELRLADVAEALRPVLQETQDHVRELEMVLGR